MSTIKVNALEGRTTADAITITNGSVTTIELNTHLPHAIGDIQGDGTVNQKSLNVASITDGTTGLNTVITYIKKPQMFDTLQGTVGGAYASTLKVYDPLRKLEEITTYDLESAIEKGEHISGHPMLFVDDMERVLRPNELIDAQISPTIDEIDIDAKPTEEFDSLIINDYHTPHSFDNA